MANGIENTQHKFLLSKSIKQQTSAEIDHQHGFSETQQKQLKAFCQRN